MTERARKHSRRFVVLALAGARRGIARRHIDGADALTRGAQFLLDPAMSLRNRSANALSSAASS